ncbi:pre-mRNA-processing factor 19 [Lampetra planeri]
MALICSISNEVPEHPCVSPVSGHVFERRLVERFVAENGVDPVSGTALSEDQLVDIRAPHTARPKPPSATSIPAILKSLQDEWDAVMLQSHSLRQQLQTARQELSHALYQHDAACRVIARLTKEVAAAREGTDTIIIITIIITNTTIIIVTLTVSIITITRPLPARRGLQGDRSPH